jgi:branched-subunit amino acid transport protein
MSVLDDGFGGYLAILLAGVLVHEPWRWLGLALGTGIDGDSEIFRWVKAVATALVAALVMRIVVFPPGALAGVEGWLRLGAFAAGLAIFFATGRNLGVGIIGGAVVMVAGKLAVG